MFDDFDLPQIVPTLNKSHLHNFYLRITNERLFLKPALLNLLVKNSVQQPIKR